MTTPEAIHAAATGAEAFGLIGPLPPHLLDDPLEYMLADHFRQRCLCTALRAFAEAGRIDGAVAARLAAHLTREVPLHHRDEEEDLFPALRRRALPEDAMGDALARLDADHRMSETALAELAGRLERLVGAGEVALEPGTRALMRAYADSEHRHLAIENGIVMAIARARLTKADLRAMSRTMRERRGLG